MAASEPEVNNRQDEASRSRLAYASGYNYLAAVFDVKFMVKLLRACVWMPWLNQAMKDVANCDKPRGDVSNL